MLRALVRRPLLARVLDVTLTSATNRPSIAFSHLLTPFSLTSLLRPALLPTLRTFANVARSPAPTATAPSDLSARPAASSPAQADDSSADDRAAAGGRRHRGRSRLTAEQLKAAEKRSKQLLRAKQLERSKKEREKAISDRLKQQHRRITAQEKTRERKTLTKQRRQDTRDQLRAKSARAKQQRADERAVALQYKALQSTRPKRPLPPFLSFTLSVRSSLSAAEVPARPTDMTRLLARRWRELAPEEKSEWETQYRTALPEYRQRLAQWKEEQRSHRPPVRPLNTFARYAETRISEIIEAEGGGRRASELMKRVGAEWKNVSADEKERLKRAAAEDMAAYKERMEQWEQRPAEELALWRLQRATERKRRERRKLKIIMGKQAKEKAAAPTEQ